MKKILTTALAAILSFTATAGAGTSILAAENQPEPASNLNDDSLKSYYNALSEAEKEEFNQIVNNLNLGYCEQIKVLEAKANEDSKPQSRSKSAIIKKILKWAAEWMGSKTLADFTDFLFGWQGDLEDGCVKFLTKTLGWNKDVAYWTVHSLFFVFL